MAEVTLGQVPAREAISNIRTKLAIPTKRWDDFMGPAQAKGFTVAGATKMDLVNDLHSAVTEAIEQGQSIGQFRARFDEIVDKHGWTYKGSRGWRTRVIYDNNLRSAHMAGRWQQAQRVKKRRPYMIYMTVADQNVRPEHQRWRRYAIAIDDPWWDTHYPPNGWGCRCYVITATAAQLERMGIEVLEPPPIKRTTRINTDTGEYYGEVPEGIDTGWDYNVGKAWLGADSAFGEKLMRLPAPIRAEALANNNSHIKALNQSWGSWLKQRTGDPAGYAHAVGYVPNKAIDRLLDAGASPKNAVIVATDAAAAKLPSWAVDLPSKMLSSTAVLREVASGDLVFVLGRSGREWQTVRVSMQSDKLPLNQISAVDTTSRRVLRGADFEVLEGGL